LQILSRDDPIGGREGGAGSLEGVSPTPKELRGRVVIGTAAELRNDGGSRAQSQSSGGARTLMLIAFGSPP
jgi:hypothetical protein